MSTQNTLPYALVDVFAEAPFTGNQLAIFPDARGLSAEQMQALARETRLSETTFVLPEDNPSPDRPVRVRIFTTEEELPFAGHPSLGTATWLRLQHPAYRQAWQITLKLDVGLVPIEFGPEQEGVPGLEATMLQPNPEFGASHTPDEVAAATGIPLQDFAADLPIQTVSTGMPFCIVPMRSAEALSWLQVPQTLAEPWLRTHGAKFFYCWSPLQPGESARGARFRARMQFYGAEDPATGSAAGCLAAYLLRHGQIPARTPVVLEQGVEMLRPSRIVIEADLQADLRADGGAGSILGVRVSGRTIPVAEGRFFLL